MKNIKYILLSALLLSSPALAATQKLSAIANGGNYVTSTDQCVAVRNGNADQLVTFPFATASQVGLIKGDGSTLSINGSGQASCTTGTTSQLGCLKPDGTTITVSSGVISSSSAITPGTAGQMVYYPTTGSAISGNPNATISNGSLTLGQSASVLGSVALSGSTSGATILNPNVIASGVVTLPATTDTLVGKATTDTLTNKTFDTAGAGNVLKINGTQITAISGSAATVGTTSGVLANGHCVSIDGSGNLVDAGGACTTGGGGGTVASSTIGQVPVYTGTTTVTGAASMTYASGQLTLGTATSVLGSVKLSGSTSGTTTINPNVTASGTLTLPAATDTLIGKATTDTLTNKTYDTAGTGNVFKINGTSITSISGNSAIAASSTGALTSGHGVKIDASGNFIDSGIAASTTNQTKRDVSFAFDGGGSALTSGKIIYVSNIPYSGTITGVTLLSDQSCSATIDVWKVAYASAPPTISNTIVASALPTLSSAQKSNDTTLTGWSTTITAGDTMAFKLTTTATCQYISGSLQVTAN